MMMLQKIAGRRIKIPEVCKILGVTEPTVARYRKQGVNGIKLRVTRIGKHVFVTEQDLEDFLTATNADVSAPLPAFRTDTQIDRAATAAENRLAASGW